MAAPGLIGRNENPKTTAVQAIQQRNLRAALARISRHLEAHPILTAADVVVTNLATTPPPRFPSAAGSHFPPWHGFDAAVRCDTVLDLINWCGSVTGFSSLTLFRTAEGAELKFVAWIDGGQYTITTDAAWLAHVFNVQAGQKRQINIADLTVHLEAHSRTESINLTVAAS